MAESQTWRVVLRDGSVREVRSPDGVSGDAARVAVLRECALWHHPVAEILAPGEPTRAELAAQLAAVTVERDVLRAQQAPLLDAHDALVAAARAAGWTGAGATGAELVAWVRRGEREACAERVRYLRGDLGAEAILRGEGPVTSATEALSTAERLIGRLAVGDVIGDDAVRALPLDAPGGAT